METNLEKITKILSESSVSQYDQVLFVEACVGVVDENLELLVELFTESPEWIEKSIENFKEKRGAAHERNMQRWKEIISDEVSMLEDANRMAELRNNMEQKI